LSCCDWAQAGHTWSGSGGDPAKPTSGRNERPQRAVTVASVLVSPRWVSSSRREATNQVTELAMRGARPGAGHGGLASTRSVPRRTNGGDDAGARATNCAGARQCRSPWPAAPPSPARAAVGSRRPWPARSPDATAGQGRSLLGPPGSQPRTWRPQGVRTDHWLCCHDHGVCPRSSAVRDYAQPRCIREDSGKIAQPIGSRARYWHRLRCARYTHRALRETSTRWPANLASDRARNRH